MEDVLVEPGVEVKVDVADPAAGNADEGRRQLAAGAQLAGRDGVAAGTEMHAVEAVVVRAADALTTPLRRNWSRKFFAGSSQGLPCRHTGAIGPRMTTPRRPETGAEAAGTAVETDATASTSNAVPRTTLESSAGRRVARMVPAA